MIPLILPLRMSTYMTATPFTLRGSIDSELLLELYDFWQAHRGPNGLMPADALDPNQLPTLMAYIIIMDVEPSERTPSRRRFRYRYVGSAIDGTNGEYRTKKYLDEINLGNVSAAAIETMERAVEDRAPSHAIGDFVDSAGRALNYERLALPMTKDGKSVSSILVGLQYLLVVDDDDDEGSDNDRDTDRNNDDSAPMYTRRLMRPEFGIDLKIPLIKITPNVIRRPLSARRLLPKGLFGK